MRARPFHMYSGATAAGRFVVRTPYDCIGSFFTWRAPWLAYGAALVATGGTPGVRGGPVQNGLKHVLAAARKEASLAARPCSIARLKGWKRGGGKTPSHP